MKRFLHLVSLALITSYCFSQTICTTPAETSKAAIQSLNKAIMRSGDDTLRHYLKVYFHVIRQSNGTGGQNYTRVTNALNILNNDFSPYRIVFLWDGSIDYIDDSSLYAEANRSVFSYNDHQDGIDIYLFPDSNSFPGGSSSGVGVGSALLVSGSYWKDTSLNIVNTHVISHEMGHVLNLWHTHHGTITEYLSDGYTPYPNQCKELVNGSNSTTCGDFIADTPADPFLNYNVDPNTFTWNGSGYDANGDPYQPDVRQIMSYTDIRCMEHFSPMQGAVMRSAIEDLPYLRNIETALLDISLYGNKIICDTAIYTLIGVHPSLTVSWSINNNKFTITPSDNQCIVEYIGTLQYSTANLTATVSWQGHTIKSLTKRIVMHGTNLSVTGWQYGGQTTPNGSFPDREFTIPNNNRSLLSSTKPEKPSMEEILGRDSLPIDFIGDDIFPIEPIPYDDCGYGFTEINGGNMVYLNSTRFNDMDISFSGTYSPTAFNRNGSYISFKMPYNNNEYYTTLEVHSETQCHDFCIMFKVVPLPGSAYGDDDIWVEFIGSMLYINYMVVGVPNGNGQFYFPSFSLTISRIPSGNQVYSGIFSGEDCPIAVNTSSWLPGLYSIRLVCNNQIYTKTFHI